MHLELQRRLQKEAYGIDYRFMSNEELIQSFKDMTMALEDELHEALNEMGWKPWATSKHFNREAVQGELIDAYHFLMNLMLIAGMDENMVNKKYRAKNAVNLKRQQDGYDGVDGKCPNCKRALDDDAVDCYSAVGARHRVWCEFAREWFTRSLKEINQ